ncbi:U-box domain-containing protein 34-like [Juglans microcarpa x Juglans regia]|uniref:U-box domain-containing protein 34-like n=1 Tax=Juglans microcarpa x Juglans regia TaxID=2249226 RepID=UPI001B7F4333|nr:U-box domain-containing protein 34-like [Juglans microcarpa x Juglans regia]
MTSVAVAVNGGSGGGRGRGSRRAVRWAVKNLMPRADRFVLVHVMPKITAIPTPSGEHIPVEELAENVVEMYMEDVKLKFEEIFVPFQELCKTRKVETLLLEDNDPATALLRYVSESRIKSLVLGSCSLNFVMRMLKGPGVPTTVLRGVAGSCDIYIVSRDNILTKPAASSSTGDYGEVSSDNIEQITELHSPHVEPKVQKSFGASSISQLSYLNSQILTKMDSSANADSSENSILDQERNHRNFGGDIETIKLCNSFSSTISGQSDMQAEVEQLQLEIQNTVALYKRACEELVHAQNNVELLSSECLEEARRVNAGLEREEALRKIAAEDKAKYLEAIKEVQEAKKVLAKEANERKIAELNALKASLGKQTIVDALFSGDLRYRRYTRDEIEAATEFFSESNVIGEGGYGKVYKCSLDHTPVAVKVLSHDATGKKEEFLKEVEVLSQLRHPNVVLLLGACPESGCLVYEYLENGSLEEYIFHQNGKAPLPWFVRFQIVFEVACGLAFLHNSKPDPIVHRDLKPGNILLDRNNVSKIGDVGLAKIIYDVVPDDITEYRESILAGTLCYMDPEYLRTGTIRPKSDLYAFAVITFQLLTGRQPNGLPSIIENAITNGSLPDILDKSVRDWPLAETEELAQIALRCSKLRCRDRPDLDTEVLPVLKRVSEVAKASLRIERENIYAPKHYFCPILQEIMDDPHIAADGFTYEHEAIKAWLEKHNVSPVTRLRLHHFTLTPNHTLRSAIQEWRSRVTFSHA